MTVAARRVGDVATLGRALVAHSEPLVRRSFSDCLLDLGVGSVVEAASAREARGVARTPGHRDLAIVGVGAADGEDRALLADLHSLRWARVVVVTPQATARAVSSALMAGATGVLVEGDVGHADVPPLRLVDLLDAAAPAIRPAAPRPVVDVRGVRRVLTIREVEVLQLAADGHPNHEISERLGLSPMTIKSHLGRIGRKLGTGERAHLVLLALRAGCIS